MMWVLLQSESPWQRNNAIMFFIYLRVSLYREFFLRCLKLRFKISQKRSHRICTNFAIDEAIMAGTNSLKRFLKKKLLVQRNTKINKKRNGVVTLLWRLRLQ